MTGNQELAAALRYAIATVAPVAADQYPLPTPCRDWDLRMLLQHASDSVAALAEGYSDGAVRLQTDSAAPAADPAREFTGRAALLLARCQAGPGRDILIGGCPMPAGQLAAIGAIEMAVHAWDVSQACGTGQPIPEPLAAALLPTAVTLISAGDRPRQFAPACDVPAGVNASDRLTAFLGR